MINIAAGLFFIVANIVAVNFHKSVGAMVLGLVGGVIVFASGVAKVGAGL